MAYRHGMFGHQGGLKNPAASKAETARVEALAKKASKADLVDSLAKAKRDVNGIGGMAPEYYARLTKKELVSLCVIYLVHAFNFQTDNYD